MKPLEACRLYGFVDTAYLEGRDPRWIARALCAGGVDLIQVRAKGLEAGAVVTLARAVREEMAGSDVGLVINDYPEVAVRVEADFCHLGQEDFFAAGWRHVSEVLPAGCGVRLGLSSHAPGEAVRAVEAGAAYVAVGPVYATATKPGRAGVTLDYVRWAAQHLGLPWFAIGGLTLERLPEVVRAGARRICVVSAILQAQDVAAACREFRRELAAAESE